MPRVGARDELAGMSTGAALSPTRAPTATSEMGSPSRNSHGDTVLTVSTRTAMVISEHGRVLAPYQQKIKALETTALSELESIDRINTGAATAT